MKEESNDKMIKDEMIKDEANGMAVGAFCCGFLLILSPMLPYTWFKVSVFGISIFFGVCTILSKRRLSKILKNQ